MADDLETVAMLRFGDRLAAALRAVVPLTSARLAAHQVAMTIIVEAYRIGRADERAARQPKLPGCR